jgi:hypothetical protein
MPALVAAVHANDNAISPQAAEAIRHAIVAADDLQLAYASYLGLSLCALFCSLEYLYKYFLA